MTTKRQSQGGRLLRHFRKRRGLTQAELARSAQVSTGYIAMLENGQRQRPREAIVTRLSTALSLTSTERAELAQALLGVAPSTAPERTAPKTAIEQALADFLALPPGSPQAPQSLRLLTENLVELVAQQGDSQESEAALASARLLGMGYFCTLPGRAGGKSPRRTPELEIELAEPVQQLIQILTDGKIPASKRLSLAKELVSFAEWKIRGKSKK